MNSRTPLLAVLAVVAGAFALRTLPLYWSPLPATLDGIGFAAQARDAIALGGYPLADLRADNFVFAGLLAAAGLVLGRTPLYLAQPVVAVVGTAACLAAVAIVHRTARELDFSRRGVRAAVVLGGIALAASGLYLRRTAEPDEEAIAYLLVPLLAIAYHRYLRTDRRAWALVTGLFVLVFPLLHTFSTLLAALTLTALFAIHLHARPTRGTALRGGAVIAGFWVYFAGYYELAARTALEVPYVGRVTAHPGLFVGWIVVLIVGVVWFRSVRERSQRAILLVPVVAWIAIVLANAVRPIFPGTVPTHPTVAILVSAYLLPLLAASVAAPVLCDDRTGAVLLALLAAPVAMVGFSLSAALTPEFFGTAVRTQTFAHLSVFALAGLALAGLAVGPVDSREPWLRRPAIRGGLLCLVLASVLLTTPLAYVTLDTVAVPSTTTQEGFAGATFAATHLDEPWTSDHKRTRMATHYYATDAAVGPTAAWLRGSPDPGCPVLSTEQWTTTGAHFFPAPPETMDGAEYERWLRGHQLVYATTGTHSLRLTRPTGASSGDC